MRNLERLIHCTEQILNKIRHCQEQKKERKRLEERTKIKIASHSQYNWTHFANNYHNEKPKQAAKKKGPHKQKLSLQGSPQFNETGIQFATTRKTDKTAQKKTNAPKQTNRHTNKKKVVTAFPLPPAYPSQ